MAIDRARATWRKSSRSNANGNCVEVADNLPTVGVRDSKDPSGPALSFGRGEWTAFLDQLKGGRLQ